ncbi:Biphenyl dioxygenase subunit beta [compost metagenome]
MHSVFVNYRSRGEADNDLLLGRREDLLRLVDGDFRIARRKIVITQSLFMSKNLNTFL